MEPLFVGSRMPPPQTARLLLSGETATAWTHSLRSGIRVLPLPGPGIPEEDLVNAKRRGLPAAGDPPTVAGECNGSDLTRVPVEQSQGVPLRQVPQDHGVVAALAGQRLAIGREGNPTRALTPRARISGRARF